MNKSKTQKIIDNTFSILCLVCSITGIPTAVYHMNNYPDNIESKAIKYLLIIAVLFAVILIISAVVYLVKYIGNKVVINNIKRKYYTPRILCAIRHAECIGLINSREYQRIEAIQAEISDEIDEICELNDFSAVVVESGLRLVGNQLSNYLETLEKFMCELARINEINPYSQDIKDINKAIKIFQFNIDEKLKPFKDSIMLDLDNISITLCWSYPRKAINEIRNKNDIEKLKSRLMMLRELIYSITEVNYNDYTFHLKDILLLMINNDDINAQKDILLHEKFNNTIKLMQSAYTY